ncbi:MAG: NAD-dependent epimerase/dehydratase family protein [Gammaproteobacteria bacterium]|nr:NAD-dependent epimerase/dehydratase family protein [Gammaproteobacteria bacterium]
MKALITGATGFIGQYLGPHLCRHGFQLRALTRNLNQSFVRAHSDWEWVEGDVCDSSLLSRLCTGVEVIFHLAGFAHAWEEQQPNFQALHHAVNAEGTLNLARAAAEAGVKRFIFFSSIKAVAETNICVDEEFKTWPTDAYGRAKRMAEEGLLKLQEETGMQVMILRPTLVYGPGWKGNLAALLRAIDRGYFPPPPPYPNQKSMVSVFDLCEAARLASFCKSAKHSVFIVSDGHTYSTFEIDRSIRKALGKKLPRLYWPLWVFKALGRLGDGFSKCLCRRVPFTTQTVSKLFGNMCYRSKYIQSELGFIPRDRFESALPEIIRQYREESPC